MQPEHLTLTTLLHRTARACAEARADLAVLQSVRVRSATPTGWAVAETFTPQ